MRVASIGELRIGDAKKIVGEDSKIAEQND